jgi:integrase
MAVYKRGQVWWVRFQANGEEVRRSAHTGSRAVAEKYERELRAEFGRISRGGKPRRSFEDAALEFMSEHLPSIKDASARRYRTSLKALAPYFGELYLDQITKAKLAEYVRDRKREVTPTTVRRDLACLSSLFSREIGLDNIDGNPVRDMDKRAVKEAPPRTRYLTHDEEARLIKACKPYMRHLVEFAIDTGLRLEEHLSLEWPSVDLKRAEIRVERTKTDVPRTVPLLDRSSQILAHQPRHIASPFVFTKRDGSRYGKLTRGLAGAAKRAGIKDLRWHDLRRTCGCRLLQDHGLDIYRVSRWLGHKSVAVTERSYAFLRTDDLRPAAQKPAQGTRIDQQEGA